MSWSAPMTAVSGTAFTAAQFNQFVRDNLLETTPAKATAASQIFVSTATNAVVARTPTHAQELSANSTTSTTYVALTGGPPVTVTTGTRAIIGLTCQFLNNTAGLGARMSFEISGATSVSANDNWSIGSESGNPSDIYMFSGLFLHEGLTPGSHTFASRYRATGGGTADFNRRRIMVIPL